MESEYTVSDNEIVFFFSSAIYRNKFFTPQHTNRKQGTRTMEKLLAGHPFRADLLADLNLYETIETRGFYVTLKGREVPCKELYQYALQKLTEPSSPN